MTRRLAALAMLATGCGAPTWPAPVTATATASHDIHTIDVLPFDLALWTEADGDADPAKIRSSAEAHLMNVTLTSLATHAYGVDAVIDWNGDYDRGGAMPSVDLDATLGALARYSASPATRELPVPVLPVRLGTATGADATLYVGGWAYVATYHESTAHKVGKDVLIGIAIVGAVVAVGLILGVLLRDAHGSSHGSLPSRGGGSSVAGSHSAGASHAAADGGDVARVVTFHGAGSHHGERAGGLDGERLASNIASRVIDHVADAAIDSAIDAMHPDWANDPALPHSGGSRMFLEMTLVDNRTGRALWHVHQVFPASAASAHDVERAARVMLASLPAA
jgi:hypothetical protein